MFNLLAISAKSTTVIGFLNFYSQRSSKLNTSIYYSIIKN